MLLLAGCGQSEGGQSTLHGESDQTRKIIHLWWGMLAAAAVVFGGALLLLAIAYRRRTREGLPAIGKDEDVSTGLVVAFGVVIPVVCLVTLFFISDIGVVNATSAPKPGQTKMNVSVVGHQWFWEYRYPKYGVVFANEPLVLPVGKTVAANVTSIDVIHSWFVPEFGIKMDANPGRINHVWFQVEKIGKYEGQCAELCGVLHGQMFINVTVVSPEEFDRWIEQKKKGA